MHALHLLLAGAPLALAIVTSHTAHPVCPNKEVISWLQDGAEKMNTPECVPDDIADVLKLSSAKAAMVLQRYENHIDLSNGVRVARINMSGQVLSLLQNNYRTDIDSAASYDLENHRISRGGLGMIFGSADGMLPILLAQLNPHSHVVTFEPSSQKRFFVEMNLALNSFSNVSGEKSATHFKANATRKTHTVPTSLYSTDVSFLQQKAQVVDGRRSERADNMTNTTTFLSVLAEFGVSKVDLLILDCEGCEYEIVPKLSNDMLDRIEYACGELHPPPKAPALQLTQVNSTRDVMCAYGWNMRSLVCNPLRSWY